jgi:hypothetical protein
MPKSGTARPSRAARWLCLEGLLALACVERGTPAPAVAAVSLHEVAFDPVQVSVEQE